MKIKIQILGVTPAVRRAIETMVLAAAVDRDLTPAEAAVAEAGMAELWATRPILLELVEDDQ